MGPADGLPLHRAKRRRLCRALDPLQRTLRTDSRLLFLGRDMLLGGDAIALIAACLGLQGALIGILVAAFLREPDLRGSVLQHVLIAAARATVPLRAALARGRTQHGADDGADAADRYASVVCRYLPPLYIRDDLRVLLGALLIG